jgi:hypothetical protein
LSPGPSRARTGTIAVDACVFSVRAHVFHHVLHEGGKIDFEDVEEFTIDRFEFGQKQPHGRLAQLLGPGFAYRRGRVTRRSTRRSLTGGAGSLRRNQGRFSWNYEVGIQRVTRNVLEPTSGP